MHMCCYSDAGSSLGRLRLLTEQDAALMRKQQSLEAELQRQNVLLMQLQEKTKSASQHPDELSSQHLSTLFRESHCQSLVTFHCYSHVLLYAAILIICFFQL